MGGVDLRRWQVDEPGVHRVRQTERQEHDDQGDFTKVAGEKAGTC